MAAAVTTVEEAKREYDVILVEMRDPDFKQLYGVEKVTEFMFVNIVLVTLYLISDSTPPPCHLQLASVKDIAKMEWTKADK